MNFLKHKYQIYFFHLCYFSYYTFQPEVAGLIYNVFSYSKFWIMVIIGPVLALVPDITFKQIFYASWPNPTEYIKQHLRDPLFISMINVEESHSIMFNPPEARKAEKVLKEILKKARDHKLKRRCNVIAEQRGYQPDTIRESAMQYMKLSKSKNMNRRSTDVKNNPETKSKIESYLSTNFMKNKTMAPRVTKTENFLRVDSISGSNSVSNSKKSVDCSVGEMKMNSMRENFEK